MLLRGTTAIGVLLVCVLLSARVLVSPPEWLPLASEDDGTLSLAPLSLGHPAAAAGLHTRPPLNPHGTNTGAHTLRPYSYPVRAEPGDTLSGLLVGNGVSRTDAQAAIDAMKALFDPRRIRAGQEITVAFERGNGEDTKAKAETQGRFLGFSLALDYARQVIVRRGDAGAFKATAAEKELHRHPTQAAGEIRNSLFVDARRAGIPAPVLVEMIRIFSWDVDFQRDIWPEDRFEAMYEELMDDTGEAVHHGDILYAALTLSSTRHALYRFEMPDGTVDYFDENGQSARKALMRTPIDGARLSSGFGRRKHPILGYTRMHKGVDFAAPIGTPIYAAGDGRVERAGRNGGYGNYVRIRHNGEYSTAYGHMKSFARGISAGTRVRQGQVIGYVGNTGVSTGPHLHYEILRGGTQVNPLRVKMPSGEKLKGEALARFETVRDALDERYAALAAGNEKIARQTSTAR